MSVRGSSLRLFLLSALFTGAPAIAADPAPAGNSLIGVEIAGIGDGDRSKPFVDLAKTLRPWTTIDGSKLADVDEHGWPTSDAATCLFDIRPFGAWRPPADDPAQIQPDWGGTYTASFIGQADLSFIEAGASTITEKSFDPATDTTHFLMNVPKGQGVVILAFQNTHRSPDAVAHSGITDLRILRPGYALDTKQTFTTEFLAALAPFSTLRMMDVIETNHNPGFYGDAGHHVLEWKDRHLPKDATQVDANGKRGLAWEYIIDLANTTGKDIWINIPVNASDDYVKQLSTLLKNTLDPKIKIYIEHSNEVWNFGFPQYIYNKLAAIDEVKAGHSTLNNDGSEDEETWTHRRHAKRVMDISNIFRGTVGDDAMMTRVRPVYASWTLFVEGYFKDPLNWIQKTYGPPSRFFYGTAMAHYFNAGDVAKTGSKDDILRAMRHNSDESRKYYEPFIALNRSLGLKPMIYEGGSDTGGGDPNNVASRITAERDPAMRDLITHDVQDNWFTLGGDLYMYFSLCGSYSRHGSWGLTEDIANLATPKYQTIRQLSQSAVTAH